MCFRYQLRFWLLLLCLSLVLFTCQTPSVVATTSIQRGDEANNANDYETAETYYLQYLDVAPSLGTMRNLSMESDVRRKLAHVFSTQGKYEEAEKYILSALKTDQSIPDNLLNVIEDFRLLGITRVYQGDYIQASIALDSALLLSEGMESSIKALKRLSIADTYLSGSMLRLSTGELTMSMDQVDQAMELYEKDRPEGEGMMEALLIKSKILEITGREDRALILLERSMQIAEELDYKTFRQKQVKGDIYTKQGDPEGAVEIFQEALGEAKATNIIPQMIWAHIKLADAFQMIGNIRQYNYHLREAQKLREKMEQASAQLPSLDMRMGDIRNAYDLYNQRGAALGANIAGLKLAESMHEEGLMDSAAILVNKVYDYFVAENIIEGQARALVLWSRILLATGARGDAIDKLDQCETLSLTPELSWQAAYTRGIIEYENGNNRKAEQQLKMAIEIIESLRGEISRSEFKWYFLDNKVDVYDAYVSLLTDENRIQESFTINEKARSRTFLDLLAQQSVIQMEDDSLIRREKNLLREISYIQALMNQYEMEKKSYDFLIKKKEKLDQEYLINFRQLVDTQPGYARLKTIDPVGLAEIQSVIDSDLALLEMWSGKDNLYTWVITRDGIDLKKFPISRREVKRQAAFIRNSITFGLEDELFAGLRKLLEDLTLDIQEITKGYGNLVIVPHGPLHFIPFQALYDGEAFLLESKLMSYAPSASVFYYVMSREISERSVSFMGMALGELNIEGFDPLPGTAMELEQLSQLYDQGDIAYAGDIKEESFKEKASEHKTIHIATHGVLNSHNPNKSYVLMAKSENDDGRLSVEEIYNIKLNADLVALSACETGLGDLSTGDELVGLSRAFLYAGTSAVVVSLWQVDDISTSILMTRMHQLLDAGYSSSAALAQAQRDLLNSNFEYGQSRGMRSVRWHQNIRSQLDGGVGEKYVSPYFWAPFILIGNPN